MGYQTNQQIDSVSGLPVDQESTAGAAHVTLNGAVTAVSGTIKAHPVTTADANPATTTAGLIKGTFKAAWYQPGHTEIATTQAVILGFSTTANDETNLGAILTAFDASIAVPDGLAHSNVLLYGIGDQETLKAIWDDTTTLKTIMVRGTNGAGPAAGIVWTIE